MLDAEGKSATICPLRVLWPDWFPPEYVHVPWKTVDPNGTCLATHRDFVASKEGSCEAARRVVENLLQDFVLGEISGCICDRETFVLSPMKPPAMNDNILAYTYGSILAQEMGLDVFCGVYQTLRTRRDLSNFWRRFANPPEFYGRIKAGCDYIIADDVLTLGGTLAGLRALIEWQGGRVVCMTTLAGGKSGPTAISLAAETRMGLRYRHGTRLDEMLEEELGYGVDKLTEPEASRLLKESVDGVRAHIVRERHR